MVVLLPTEANNTWLETLVLSILNAYLRTHMVFVFFCLFFRENKIGKKGPAPLCCNIYYFCYCLNKEMLEVHGMLYLLELDIWRFFLHLDL